MKRRDRFGDRDLRLLRPLLRLVGWALGVWERNPKDEADAAWPTDLLVGPSILLLGRERKHGLHRGDDLRDLL